MRPQPHILVFVTDQQQVATIGGGTPCRTPHLDALAARGVVFENAFCPTPLCTPSRASVQTGLLPHQHRLVHNTHGSTYLLDGLRFDTPMLGGVLARAGYRTTYIGKWHVGRGDDHFPNRYGYQQFLYPVPPAPTAPVTLRDAVRLPGEHPRGDGRLLLSAITSRPAEESGVFAVAGETCRAIREGAPGNQPFFIFASCLEPHLPCYCPERFAALCRPDDMPLPASFDDDLSDKPPSYRDHFLWNNFCRLQDRPDDVRRFLAHYYGVISMIDEAFSRILAALDEAGCADSTVVIFTSDHGELAGAHGLIGKEDLLCDELVRVPLVVRDPATAPRRVGAFVNLTDLFATCLDLAGAADRPPAASRSLVPLWRGGSADGFPSEIVLEHHGSQFFNTVRGIRTPEYKYVFRAHERDELYDLRADPGEQRNRIDDPALASVLKRLRARLVERMHETGDQAATGMRNVLLDDLPTVYVIGDSISIGYGPSLNVALGPGIRCRRKHDLLAALRDLDIPDGANNGDSGMVVRFVAGLFAGGRPRPDLLVVNCGLHDIKTDKQTGLRQIPPDAYSANLRRIATRARDAGVPLVWVRTTPVDEPAHNRVKPFYRYAADVDAYNRIADAVMAEAGVPAADLHAFTLTLDQPLGGDGVHFLPAAQEAQGRYVAREILRLWPDAPR